MFRFYPGLPPPTHPHQLFHPVSCLQTWWWQVMESPQRCGSTGPPPPPREALSHTGGGLSPKGGDWGVQEVGVLWYLLVLLGLGRVCIPPTPTVFAFSRACFLCPHCPVPNRRPVAVWNFRTREQALSTAASLPPPGLRGVCRQGQDCKGRRSRSRLCVGPSRPGRWGLHLCF